MAPEKDMDTRLQALEGAGVSIEALVLYGRWWQLETYLREMVYTELRACHGAAWIEQLGGGAASRAQRDELNAYMASADAGDALSYLDVSRLFDLIARRWELFEPVLIPRVRWDGLMDEMRQVRHRVAHCRRPHSDDIHRLELALRSLEHGACRFYGTYTTTHRPTKLGRDPIVRGWMAGKHPDAERLLDHARRQYDVRMTLSWSKRPWADRKAGKVTGELGLLWQVDWFLGGHELLPGEWWQRLSGSVRELIVHALASGPYGLTVTFAAVDDPKVVGDAIGACFDALLETSQRSRMDDPGESDAFTKWVRLGTRMPPRLQLGSTLSLFDAAAPWTIFGA
jgi:Swt1-like HEPN